ncbi:MAG: rhomboid family intramembrane serine protease, partial [Actinomycetota bacterium]
APFLHAGFAHLIANTGAFVVLGVLVAAVSRRPWIVTIGVALISGFGVWLVGTPGTVHVGASGLVYGYAAFLVAWGVLTRRVVSILVAVAVVLLYGGLVFGVLPTQSGVSWQGHLFGAVGGVVVAYWLSKKVEPTRPQ